MASWSTYCSDSLPYNLYLGSSYLWLLLLFTSYLSSHSAGAYQVLQVGAQDSVSQPHIHMAEHTVQRSQRAILNLCEAAMASGG